MRRQFRIDPRQVEHRCDLADGMIIRHGVSKAERIEKLPLILVEPPHHCAPPPKTVLQTRNHRSTHASTDFCNKIWPEADIGRRLADRGHDKLRCEEQSGSVRGGHSLDDEASILCSLH